MNYLPLRRILVRGILTVGIGALGCQNLSAQDQLPVKPTDRHQTFTVIPKVEVELEAAGRSSQLWSGKFNIVRKMLGTADTPFNELPRPFAKASAKVDIVRQSTKSIDIRLGTRVVTRGDAEARGAAKAMIAVSIPPDLRHGPVLLRVIPDKPEEIDVSVKRSDGTPLDPLVGRPGYYVIAENTDDIYVINSQVGKSEVENPLVTESLSVNLKALVEPAALMASRPYLFILDGVETQNFVQVGSIRYDGLMHCTATLVAPRTLLTAAHCVAGYKDQIGSGRFDFALGWMSTTPESVFRVESAVFPDKKQSGYFYSPTKNYTDDIALVYLADTPSVSPASIHKTTPDWATLKNQELEFVGYGYNGSGTSSKGIKRTAKWKIDQVQARKISWSRTTSYSTCQYDSGGPAFQAQTAIVVGVTSAGAADCSHGVNTRVDAFWPWLDGKLK